MGKLGDGLKAELAERLRKLWDSDEYVETTIVMCRYEENWNKMLEFMNRAEAEGDELTADDMTALSLILREEYKEHHQGAR